MSSGESPLRLALVGGHGHHYLRGLLDVGSGRPVDVAVSGDGHDDAAAQRMADALQGCIWHDDLNEMMDAFRPQLVSVGAVYGYNAPCIAAAIQRDIPVVSDKPIAATWQQLDRLRDLLRRRGGTLITEFDSRSRPAIRAARRAVAEGLIGDVVLATAQKSYRFGTRPAWYADRESYGGTMLWVASHGIDAIRFVTDKPFRRVRARHANVSKPDFGSMEDHCVAMFELDGGATGMVHADYLRPEAAPTHGDDRLRVAGSHGVVEVRDQRCTLITNDTGPREITRHVATRPVHEELLDGAEGTCRALYSTRHSLELAAVMLASRDAADQQRTVEITASMIEGMVD